MSKYFGIDFGTTTTAFTAYDKDQKKFITIGDKVGNPFHSVVIIDKLTGNISHRGLDAWKIRNQFAVDKNNIVVSSVKQDILSDKIWKTNVCHWKPEMVAEEILSMGVDGIKERWPETSFPIRAVMAVPVDFEYEERKKITEAAKKAGIEVDHFISEPSSAIIGWQRDLENVQHALVFDWGGGTLDVSILRIFEGRIVERAKKGIRLGGDIIDEVFARHLHNKHMKEHENIPHFDGVDPLRKDSILVSSEHNKRKLSKQNEIEIILSNYCGSKTLKNIIDRNIFDEVINNKIQDVMNTVESTLSEISMSHDEIDIVLMVGGSSNIPIIKRKMDKIFGSRCEFPEDPGWLIAKGAAKLAANPGKHTLSKSIGIVLSDNSFLPVLEKGKPIDYQVKSITLGLVEDSKEARLIIAESDAERISFGNYQIIDTLFMNIPVAGYHFEPIEVNFCIQKDLSLLITAMAKFQDGNLTEKKVYPHLKFEYNFNQEQK